MKVNVVFILNDVNGGVASVVNNVLRFSPGNKVNYRVILTHKHDVKNVYERVKQFSTKHTIERFVYFKNENFYAVCKRLLKLINPYDIVVANDWLELGMISNLGLQNKVIFILHGDYKYYYQLAEKHQDVINLFICVSEHIKLTLINYMPHRVDDILHLSHPIPEIDCKKIYNYNNPLNLIFIGRLIPKKGYNLLPLINNVLLSENIETHWNIVGFCADKESECKRWGFAKNVSFLGNIPNSELLETLKHNDVFVLPTLAEGFPVTLVETMKAGIVPLISDLPSGIPELVESGVNGFMLNVGDVSGYAEKIANLHNNRSMLKQWGHCAKTKSDTLFNPFINGTAYEDNFLVLAMKSSLRRKKAKKIYGSRLDQPWIPNSIVKLLRNYL